MKDTFKKTFIYVTTFILLTVANTGGLYINDTIKINTDESSVKSICILAPDLCKK